MPWFCIIIAILTLPISLPPTAFASPFRSINSSPATLDAINGTLTPYGSELLNGQINVARIQIHPRALQLSSDLLRDFIISEPQLLTDQLNNIPSLSKLSIFGQDLQLSLTGFELKDFSIGNKTRIYLTNDHELSLHLEGFELLAEFDFGIAPNLRFFNNTIFTSNTTSPRNETRDPTSTSTTPSPPRNLTFMQRICKTLRKWWYKAVAYVRGQTVAADFAARLLQFKGRASLAIHVPNAEFSFKEIALVKETGGFEFINPRFRQLDIQNLRVTILSNETAQSPLAGGFDRLLEQKIDTQIARALPRIFLNLLLPFGSQCMRGFTTLSASDHPIPIGDSHKLVIQRRLLTPPVIRREGIFIDLALGVCVPGLFGTCPTISYSDTSSSSRSSSSWSEISRDSSYASLPELDTASSTSSSHSIHKKFKRSLIRSLYHHPTSSFSASEIDHPSMTGIYLNQHLFELISLAFNLYFKEPRDLDVLLLEKYAYSSQRLPVVGGAVKFDIQNFRLRHLHFGTDSGVYVEDDELRLSVSDLNIQFSVNYSYERAWQGSLSGMDKAVSAPAENTTSGSENDGNSSDSNVLVRTPSARLRKRGFISDQGSAMVTLKGGNLTLPFIISASADGKMVFSIPPEKLLLTLQDMSLDLKTSTMFGFAARYVIAALKGRIQSIALSQGQAYIMRQVPLVLNNFFNALLLKEQKVGTVVLPLVNVKKRTAYHMKVGMAHLPVLQDGGLLVGMNFSAMAN